MATTTLSNALKSKFGRSDPGGSRTFNSQVFNWGAFDIKVETTVSGGSLLDVFEEIRQYYIAVAKDEIAAFEKPENVVVVVDGKTNGNIENATLNGTGILIWDRGAAAVEELKRAFNAAMAVLNSVSSQFIRTGYYRSSANTSNLFTIRVNGIEQMPVWDQATAGFNVQIYSKARYAAPLEVMKDGRIFLAARNAAKAAGGELINVSFTYRDPKKMGQVQQFAKRSGMPFRPLAVPVLEIGTDASGTSNYIGNVSRNLNRGEATRRLQLDSRNKNLIHRRIVPESRWHDLKPNRPRR